ncbi:MAG: hypothetical protein U0234_22935 [Sandaracinus sp.]
MRTLPIKTLPIKTLPTMSLTTIEMQRHLVQPGQQPGTHPFPHHCDLDDDCLDDDDMLGGAALCAARRASRLDARNPHPGPE